MTLLPVSCRLPGHRVLGSAEGLPVISHFELALFCRKPQDALQQALAAAAGAILPAEINSGRR